MATFTDSIELDLADFPIEFATDIFVSANSGVFMPNGFELDFVNDLPIEFSTGIYISTGSGVFVPGTVELRFEDLPIEFATGISSRPVQGVFIPGTIELDISAVVYQDPDHTLELVLGTRTPTPIQGNTRMVDILYPVIPVNEVNRVVFKTDSQELRVAQKSQSAFTRRKSTIRFRVDTSALKDFLDNLHSNRAVTFRLQTPGYTPFGVNSQENWVRLLDHSGATRERGGQTYTIDVTFLFVGTYP